MPLRVYDMKTSKARLLDWRAVDEEGQNYTTGVLSCFFGYLLYYLNRQREEEVVAVSPNRDIRLF